MSILIFILFGGIFMSDKKQLIKSVFVGVLTSALTEIILMSLFSVLIITSGLLPADITDYIMVAVTAMSVFCGGFICAKVNKSSGLICGLLTAAAVFVIITVIGLLQSEAVLTPLSLIKLGAMLICGCAGGKFICAVHSNNIFGLRVKFNIVRTHKGK